MLNNRFKRSIAATVLGLTVLVSNPTRALARQDDDVERYDARTQGYEPNTELKSWTTGTAWMLTVVLMVVCFLPMFKDAKRTHLD